MSNFFNEALRILELMRQSFWPMFRAALTKTVPLTLISFSCGLVIAIIVALMRMSKSKVLQAIAKFYIWAIRGIPCLVLLFIIFFGLPSIGITLQGFWAAAVGFSMNQGAYNSEVIRAAFLSIPKGQQEASQALGMSRVQTLVHVLFPQAMLVAVPSLGNGFISLLKDTSLAATLTVRELFMVGRQYSATNYEPLAMYLEVGFIYLIFSTVLTVLVAYLEKRLGKHLRTQQDQKK